MAPMERFAEGADRPQPTARGLSPAILQEAATWFVASIAGMLLVFVGLGIDAYRHNHSAAEESLLSLSNPGHLLAAIGLVIVSLSVLLGLSIGMMKSVADRDSAIRRLVGVTAAWVVLGVVAFSSITYIGASGVTVGHGSGGSTDAVTANSHAHDAGAAGEAGIAAGLQQQGIAEPEDPSKVEGALTQGSNGKAGSPHDHGQHPTFTQLETKSFDELLPQFPAGTVTAEDLPTLKAQVDQVRQVALQFPTPASAQAAGYVRTTSDVPYMGEHYLNYDLVRKGTFDPVHPQGLLFSKIDGGGEKLVGVWFLLFPGVGGTKRDVEPAGFAGNLDLWHAHTGLCLVSLSGASEGETKEGCQAKGGNFIADLRWMMHVWVTPDTTENPAGFFAYLNNDLYQKQVAVKQASSPSGTIPQ